MAKRDLGDEVKDPITGFKGVAIGRTSWLHGCDRIVVQPRGVDKDGKIFESQSFDEPQLKIIKKGSVKEGTHATGGFDIKIKQKMSIKK